MSEQGHKIAMAAFPAQPDNLPQEQAAGMLLSAAAVLLYAAWIISRKRPTRKLRETVYRALCGVVGDVEIVLCGMKR